MMMFCPKCKSLLKPMTVAGKRVLGCSCGYRQVGGSMSITEKNRGAKEVHVVEERDTRPLTDARCGKCGHGKAHFWSMQTRAADEPETRFFKCEKCGHTWREYK